MTQAISRRELDRDGGHEGDGPKRRRFEAQHDLDLSQHLQPTGNPATGSQDGCIAVAPGQTVVSSNLTKSMSDVPLIIPQLFFSILLLNPSPIFRQVQALDWLPTSYDEAVVL